MVWSQSAQDGHLPTLWCRIHCVSDRQFGHTRAPQGLQGVSGKYLAKQLFLNRVIKYDVVSPPFIDLLIILYLGKSSELQELVYCPLPLPLGNCNYENSYLSFLVKCHVY